MKRIQRLVPVLLVAILLGVAVFVGLRFYLSSAAAARQVARSLDDLVGLPVEVEGTSLGLLGGSTVQGLRVREKEGDHPPILTVKQVTTDLTVTGALRGIMPREVTLTGVHLTLRFDRDGKLLSRLPEMGKGDSDRPLPSITLREVQLTIDQAQRPPVTLHGDQMTIESNEGALEGRGSIDDPVWGTWTVTAHADPDSRAVRATLVTEDVAVSQSKLASLPFVPHSVWEQVQLQGRVPLRLTLRYLPDSPTLRYRVVSQPRDLRVSVPSIAMNFRDASGEVIVEDGRVGLRNVRGRAANGTVTTSADMDFSGPATQMSFDITGKGLAVAELPKSWSLPVDNGRLGGWAKLKVSIVEGKVKTDGTGEGKIEGVDFAGGTGTIGLKLQGESGRFQFRPANQVSHEVRVAPEWGDLSRFADELTSRAGHALVLTGQVTNRTLSLVGQATRRMTGALARAGTPAAPNQPPTYLTANLSFQDVQLEQLVQRLGIQPPVPVSGRLSFDLKVELPVDTPRDLKAYRLEGSLDLATLRVGDLAFEAARARLRYRDGILALSELKGRMPHPGSPREKRNPGTFDGQARLEVVPRGELSFQFAVENIPLTALDLLLPEPYRGLAGTASGQASGRAPFEHLQDPARWTGRASLNSPEVGWLGLRLRTFAVAGRLDKGTLTVPGLRGQVENAELSGKGTLQLAPPTRVDASVTLDGFDLSALARLAPAFRLPVPVAGTVRLDATARGPIGPGALTATGRVRAKSLTVDRTRLESVAFDWSLDNDRLKVDQLRTSLYGGEVTGSATVPLRGTESGSARLVLKGVEVGEALRSVAEVPVRVEGRLSGNVKATLATAKDGERTVAADVDFEAPELRVQQVPAERLTGQVRYQDGQVEYRLQADALGGKVRLNGRIPGIGPGKGKTQSRGPEGTLRLIGVRLRRLLVAVGYQQTPRPLQNASISLDVPFRLMGPRRTPVGTVRYAVNGIGWTHPGFPRELRGSLELRENGIRVPRTTVRLDGGSLRVQVDYRYAGGGALEVSLSGVESAQLVSLIPALEDTLQGRISGEARLQQSGWWTGSGSVTMNHGLVYGVEVDDWRMPFTVSMASDFSSGSVGVAESSARVGQGRGLLRFSASWQPWGGIRLDGSLRLIRARLRSLLARWGDFSSYAEGQVTGNMDFGGRNLRSRNDLTATLRVSLEQTQALQLPVLAQIAPYLGQGRTAMFETGQVVARLANGIFRIERLELTGRSLELFAQGTITLEKRLDLEVTARTQSQICCDNTLLRALALRIPAIGPIPVGTLARISTLLSNRVIHLRVTGTLVSPQIHVEPLRILTEEAARYFLFRVLLPLPVPVPGVGL